MDRSDRLKMVLAIVAAIFVAGIVVAVFNGSAAGGANAWHIPSFAIAFMIVFVLVVVIARRRRRTAGTTSAAEIAERLDLTYEKNAERGFHQAFGPLPGVPRGGSVQHLFTGERSGRLLNIFQHMYMIHTGQASVPIYHTVYVTTAPHWPAVTVAPRKAWSRLIDAVLRRPRLLLEDEAFNHAFNVKTHDEDFALTLLHPEMQRFMTDHRAVAWQANSGWMAMVYSGALKFDRLEASLDRLREFWVLVPEELEAW